MTVNEINFAMQNREPVLLARGSVTLSRPLTIRGLTKVRRSKFDEERLNGGYYWEVQLIDASGRGWIDAAPEQLDPAEPEKFASMLAWYNEAQARKKGGVSDGGEQ